MHEAIEAERGNQNGKHYIHCVMLPGSHNGKPCGQDVCTQAGHEQTSVLGLPAHRQGVPQHQNEVDHKGSVAREEEIAARLSGTEKW